MHPRYVFSVLALLLALLGAPAQLRAGESRQRLRDRALTQVTSAGRRACVVIDVDNTVADTRYRTRAAATAFARQQPTARRLASLPIGRIRWNGGLTALEAGLDRKIAGDFQRYWQSFFWNPSSFRHDRPMRSTIELAWAAKQAGAEVFYLTGRTAALQPGTVSELRRLGLPDADPAHVLCKRTVEDSTLAFKRASLQKLAASGKRVAWFLSDSAAELRAVSDLVSCIAVDFPVRAPESPRIPAPMSRLRYGRR